MAIPSSSSSIVAPQKYGVFLSLRGRDTRNTFVSHLYEALQQQGIPTFIDSEEFKRGSEVSEIVDEIKKSNVSVVILSTNYADSPWCLEELVKIMECRKTQRQHVLPVFYRVDPSHVKNQTGSYGAAFEKHQADQKNTAETLQCWRNALIEVANLSGRVFIDNSSEAQAIKDIVKDISNILQPFYPYDFQDLVGMQQRIQQVESLLCIGETNIRVIGIWGMGGLGKTTLAKALFNKYNSHFNGSCFLENVRERSNSQGLEQLKEDLVLDIFDGKKYGSTHKMLKQLCHKKILVVLDDVDDPQQFEKIFGNYKMHPGSRIIITSRDRQVLRNLGSHEWIYEIKALEEKESLQLFMLYAMKEDHQQKWHLELSKRFANYAQGNPLGLKIMGRHLQGKGEQEWRSALRKIKEGPDKELTKALKISFDGLNFHEQQIFLDIACFFNRSPTSEVCRILYAYYGSSLQSGLRNLEDKSLVTMSNPYIDMHDLLEEMGKEVVREESRKEPGKRSRLWNHEDIYQVLTNNTGSEAVEGILMVNCQKSLTLASTVFAKMPKLKLLKFSLNPFYGFKQKIVELPEGLEFLPKDELRHFEWPSYPLRSLPSNFVPEKLVTLDISKSEVKQLWNGVWKFPNLYKIDMTNSKIKRLWIEIQDMPNLKILKLSGCKYLIEMPDLSKAPKLEKLLCYSCENLEEVSPSISHLSNLEELDFDNCEKIKIFPSTVSMMRLKALPLRNCSNLIMFPEVSRNINTLDLKAADIKEIPFKSFQELSCLKKLHLGGNKKLVSLPNSLGCLSSLEDLNVPKSSIESIPTSIIQLSQLQKLNIRGCERLRCLPELPPSVCVLRADGCKSLQNVSFSTRYIPVEVSKRQKFDFNDDCMLKFWFTNCIKLDESAREEIYAFAQQSIINVVAPKINEVVDEYHDHWKPIKSHFVIPGNEMPGWIQHQSGGGGGSSITITIDFQPLNLLGILFCAVFDFGEGYDLIDHKVEIWFKVQLNSNYNRIRTDWMLFSKVASQHVLLCYAAYDPNEPRQQSSKYSATMEVMDMEGNSMEGKVMKWGLSLIYDYKDHNFKQWEVIWSSFFIPQNEMPYWIKHQSGGGGGSSITIDFQPLNLLGFIFCAVFDFHLFDNEYPTDQAVDILFEVQLNSNHCVSRRESILMRGIKFPGMVSQHLLAGHVAYVPTGADSRYSELSVTLKDEILDGRVVKWGLSPIYKEGDDEKEFRHDKGKRIAYEENADD